MTKDIALLTSTAPLPLSSIDSISFESRPRNWHGNFAACVDDPPNQSIIEILQSLQTTG